MQVYVDGRLSSHTYQIQTGETRFSNDISGQDIQFLGQRGGSSGGDAVGVASDISFDRPLAGC